MRLKIQDLKRGWVKAVAGVIDKKEQKVNGWMKRYMSDFYTERCKNKMGCALGKRLMLQTSVSVGFDFLATCQISLATNIITSVKTFRLISEL